VTSQVQDEYIFTSRVKSLGEQQNNDGWRLELEWKLPGSKYPLYLYGQDWEDVKGLGAGSTAQIHISKGKLKNDKDGRYSSDYFWDMTYIETGEDSTPDYQPAPPSSRTGPPEPQRVGLTRPDDVHTRIDIGMAFNAAYTLIAGMPDELLQGETLVTTVRQLRDLLYREVIQKGIAPEGYCYLHEEGCRMSQQSGKWGHQMVNGWCIDGVLDVVSPPQAEEDSPLVQTAMGMGATQVSDFPESGYDQGYTAVEEEQNLEDEIVF